MSIMRQTVDITIPKLGLSMESAVIQAWHKQEGDAIALDEPIVSIETDKITHEIVAPASGTLETILVHEGENAPVLSAIGRIATGSG